MSELCCQALACELCPTGPLSYGPNQATLEGDGTRAASKKRHQPSYCARLYSTCPGGEATHRTQIVHFAARQFWWVGALDAWQKSVNNVYSET
jgi:hypothetical protein